MVVALNGDDDVYSVWSYFESVNPVLLHSKALPSKNRETGLNVTQRMATINLVTIFLVHKIGDDLFYFCRLNIENKPTASCRWMLASHMEVESVNPVHLR